MKKWFKRITAAGLVVCLLLALIPLVQKDKGTSTLEVSASDSTPMVRGVVNSLHELPHYQNEANRAAARGTADHPFVILELVPYEELAEFGYKVSGLEPVAVDEMYGRQELGDVGVTGEAEVTQRGPWYFFMEEPEAKDYQNMYDHAGTVPIEQDSTWQTPYYGYYEVVEEGTGTFRAQEIAVSAVSVARVGSGMSSDTDADPVGGPEAINENGEDAAAQDEANMDDAVDPDGDDADVAEGSDGVENTESADTEQADESDTVELPEDAEGLEGIEGLENTEILEATEEIEDTESTEEPELRQLLFEREEGGNLIWHTVNVDQEDYDTARELAGDMSQKFESLGDRFYTTRTPSNDDPAIWVTYFTYDHKESFLTDTLKLSPEEAENYSIVIKTITPRELNNSPEWIDYADLICVSQASHVNKLPALWQKYNRLHKPASVDVNAISTYGFTKVDDISWDVTMRIFDRVTAEEDYAALAMDNGVYYNYDQKRSVNIDVLDWNLDSSGWNVNPGDAGDRNLYKLAVMLLCMDHSLFRSLYLSGENPVIQNGVNTLQKGDAANYWSPQTFLLVPPLTDRLPGYWDANSYWGIRPEGASSDDPPLIWTNYKMVPIISGTDDWVSGHVYGYHTSADFTMKYTSSQLNMIYKTEFDATGDSTPSDAVRYILGTDGSKETVAWKDKLRILDIEPCVDLVWGQDGNSNGNNGSQGDTTTVYFYNSDSFTGVIAHAWKNDSENLTGDWGTTKAIASQTLGGKWTSVTVPSAPGFHIIFADQITQTRRTTVDINDSKNVYVVMGDKKFSSKAAAEAYINNTADDGGSYNRPNWVLTESYVRMLLPTFRGEIEIIHQTTAEFNGKVEDLNSTYDMIYLGLDFGAYNTRSMNLMLDGEMRWNVVYPDWNDNEMDGLIYFHNGDKLYAMDGVYGVNRSVRFLWNPKNGNNAQRLGEYKYLLGTQTLKVSEMRFPGNDITSIKKKELEDFIAGGHPIVATRYLYNLEDALIAGNTYIRALVADKKGNGVYSTTQTAIVTDAAARAREVVIFNTIPALYNGETSGNGSVITNPNYLPMSAGRSYLEFSFDVAEEGYNYSIYIDQNSNSKFTSDEIVVSNQARMGTNNYTYRLASSMVGLVQWRLEVYRRDNPQDRYSVSGCSAARNTTGSKRKINVLQILPNNTWANGYLDLSKSDLFKKYYQDLVDYDVTITSVSWDTFSSWFKRSKEENEFHFDFGEEISATNPVKEQKLKNKVKEAGYDLDSFNMIIIGFADTYGSTNLTNDSGEVEYLQYWVAQGKSILFTHDLTSWSNVEASYGYTANIMLRDVMGMNRYGMISRQLTDEQKQSMIKYQANEGYYDTPYDVKTGHGFTYWAMKRLSYISAGSQAPGEHDWRVENSKMCYRYMITNPEGNAVCTMNTLTSKGGCNDNNDLTTVATMVNEGQITSYPYKISETLPISETHGQYYELNMEDPEVTVWYCLGDDHYCTGWNGTDHSGRGTALTYGVSPNDAANNYYIYSKGNIFYSGVGHSGVTVDMEAKLFVNTMISAYSSATEPPVAEITNPDAAVTGANTYSLSVMQEFDNGTTVGNENTQIAETFDADDVVTVTFAAVDFNPVTTSLSVRIRREDGGYIDRIVRVSDGKVFTADADHMISGLTNGTEYSVDYLKKDLENCRTIYFEMKNDKIATTNVTTLNMTIEPLFELD